jgi:hypothetical protein
VGASLGVPLFPLGTAGQEGRVYLLDESGEWLLGRGLRRALDSLLLGRSAGRVPAG